MPGTLTQEQPPTCMKSANSDLSGCFSSGLPMKLNANYAVAISCSASQNIKPLSRAGAGPEKAG